MRGGLMGAALAALIPAIAAKGAAQDEAAAIRALIGKTWDRPDEKVVTEPVVIVEDSAIAGRTQGERGGRALLKREHGAWRVVLCSGDALKEAETLVQTGIEAGKAQQVASALVEAERSVSAERRALFASFEGMTYGEHDPHQDHQDHHKH